MKYAEALRTMAERVPYQSEEQRREVLDAIDRQHAPRGKSTPEQPAPEPEK